MEIMIVSIESIIKNMRCLTIWKNIILHAFGLNEADSILSYIFVWYPYVLKSL